MSFSHVDSARYSGANDVGGTVPNWLAKIFRWGGRTRTKKSSLGEVFTPSRPANKVFVPRKKQEGDLRSLLAAPGTQILIWGESGAGKSSLALKVLLEEKRKHIITKCESDSTYANILASGFAQSKAMTDAKKTNHDTATFNSETEVGGGPAKIKAGGAWESGTSTDRVPVMPTQLTAESLAAILGQQETVWVIEDLHKVQPEVKTRVAGALKVFSDASTAWPLTTVIALGAAETPGAILEPATNMRGRLATIALPPLSRDQLGTILDDGEALMNVDLSPVRERIISSAAGVASITHGLAFETCIALGVKETSDNLVVANHEAYEDAIDRYVRTRNGNMESDFKIAMRVKQSSKYANHAIILKALASVDEYGAPHAEILAAIRKEHPEYPPGNLTTYLRELQTDDRLSLVRRTADNTYRYDQPLQYAYATRLFDIPPRGSASDWSRGIEASPESQREAADTLQESDDSEPPRETY